MDTPLFHYRIRKGSVTIYGHMTIFRLHHFKCTGRVRMKCTACSGIKCTP